MSYHTNTKAALKAAPTTLGVRLGRVAIRKGISVLDIAHHTGASRATVYNWFVGGNVSNAYRQRVEQLLKDISAK
jgi:transposase